MRSVWTRGLRVLAVTGVLAHQACSPEDDPFLGGGVAGEAGSSGAGAGMGPSLGGSIAQGGSKAKPVAGSGGNGPVEGGAGEASTGGAMAGAASGGTPSAGAGGETSGGADNGGAGAAGGAGTTPDAAGAAGMSGSAGAAGEGGGTPPECKPLPPVSQWTITSSTYSADLGCGGYVQSPDKAIDGDLYTDFATGLSQIGNEWVQIDFHETVTLNEVFFYQFNDKYKCSFGLGPVHYQVLVSSKSQDFRAPVLAEDDGSADVSVKLDKPATGRFLMIRQTGQSINWWTITEIAVRCE